VRTLLALVWLAADAPEETPVPGVEESFVDELIFVVIVLVAICLFFYVLIRWLLPRMSRLAGGRGLRIGGGKVIRVVDRCVLEPRRSLYVVEVAGRFWLLGATEGSITKLAGEDLDEPELRRMLGVPPSKPFASLLKKEPQSGKEEVR
jgi:flagellar protein FliO/FliZ